MKFWEQVSSLLEGKKTYIIAIIAMIDAGGAALGYWEESHFRTYAELVLGGVALRAGVTKSAPQGS